MSGAMDGVMDETPDKEDGCSSCDGDGGILIINISFFFFFLSASLLLSLSSPSVVSVVDATAVDVAAAASHFRILRVRDGKPSDRRSSVASRCIRYSRGDGLDDERIIHS